MTENDLLYTLALQHVPNIGDITAKRLISHCGSAEAVLKEKSQNLLKIDGIGSVTISDLFKSHHLKEAEKEIRFIKVNNIEVSYFNEANYPEKLKHCIDSPILLFQTGKIDLKNQPIISIVGARKITTSGIAFCENLVEQLAIYNPIIVSGFAYGTDITAHKAAMKHKLQTVACLAHGLNQIYPKVHKKYMVDMEKNGGFFSDFWSTDTFDKNNFLKRNRVIAGLSEATIVIESAEKGGSLVTADIAHSYNRDVFAVPGRTTDSQSIGCNNLIKHQKAHMLTTPLDVPYILGWELESEKQPVIQKQLFVELDATEKVIYNYLKENDKQQLDSIALNCNLPIFKVSGTLLNMELKGVVRPLPGKLFEVI
ncbi:DNA-protecting protein DprA [Algibacter amylolyticus]|uniref:DNA-protecting protein DprA n=1 Tax=Algibacter amylolyticus TaxID=1608400 RepID=A0A5M7BFN8_9FLAO|nr:DNA-processing protein DprA [Algibacter amylolyticus]KAA5827378.1 DNA-protecting protein DprA [Algibacter amylolyticus]MBB5266568.1 DNA processing protein [Algibacter amylolyticus]TSJ81623.1 DNA-protecting protein DprA [Algibacter amylolyticus]